MSGSRNCPKLRRSARYCGVRPRTASAAFDRKVCKAVKGLGHWGSGAGSKAGEEASEFSLSVFSSTSVAVALSSLKMCTVTEEDLRCFLFVNGFVHGELLILLVLKSVPCLLGRLYLFNVYCISTAAWCMGHEATLRRATPRPNSSHRAGRPSLRSTPAACSGATCTAPRRPRYERPSSPQWFAVKIVIFCAVDKSS